MLTKIKDNLEPKQMIKPYGLNKLRELNELNNHKIIEDYAKKTAELVQTITNALHELNDIQLDLLMSVNNVKQKDLLYKELIDISHSLTRTRIYYEKKNLILTKAFNFYHAK